MATEGQMFLRVGNHSHPAGEAGPKITRTYRFNEANQRLALIERWDIDGMIVANSQVSCRTKTQAVMDAYANLTGKDLTLYMDGGASVSAHRMRSSDSLDGLRTVAAPSFPDGRGTEALTKRTFTVSVEAEFPVVGANTKLVSYSETLTFNGGYPLGMSEVGFLHPVNGPPIKQKLKQFPIYKATQSGQAVGYGDWPIEGLHFKPIWPGHIIPQESSIVPGTPKRRGDAKYSDYPLSWTFVFMSSSPMIGKPNLWKG